jgi:hypothetical protein
MAGAGVARYWVVTHDLAWRHLDGTDACAHPGPTRTRTRTRAEAGHVQVAQHAWLVFLVVFIVVGLRLLGLAL